MAKLTAPYRLNPVPSPGQYIGASLMPQPMPSWQSQPGIPTPVQPPNLERLGQLARDRDSKFYGQDPRSLLDRYQLGEPPMPSWQPESLLDRYPVGSPQVPDWHRQPESLLDRYSLGELPMPSWQPESPAIPPQAPDDIQGQSDLRLDPGMQPRLPDLRLDPSTMPIGQELGALGGIEQDRSAEASAMLSRAEAMISEGQRLKAQANQMLGNL